jgi:hypothetical protein
MHPGCCICDEPAWKRLAAALYTPHSETPTQPVCEPRTRLGPPGCKAASFRLVTGAVFARLRKHRELHPARMQKKNCSLQGGGWPWATIDERRQSRPAINRSRPWPTPRLTQHLNPHSEDA